MIELNEKAQQDFLNREWVQKLLDAGVDMSDASYYIVEEPSFKCDIVTTLSSINKQWTLEEVGRNSLSLKDYINKFKGIPTYSISELYEQCLFERSKEYLYKDLLCEDLDRPLIIAFAEELIRYLEED